MKKKEFYPLVILILFSATLVSQTLKRSGIVEYDFYQNLGLQTKANCVLYFSEDRSTFVEGNFDMVKPVDNNTKVIDDRDLSKIKKQFLINIPEKQLFTIEEIDEEVFIAVEKFYEFKWKLLNETKKIGGFTCKKAVSEFRGRNYTAWFSEEIRVNFGPWKIHGLPGLILELKDDLQQIHIIAQNVSFVESNKIKEKLELPDNGKKITLKEYVELQQSIDDQMLKRAMSRLPKEMKVSSMSKASRKNKREVSYEWEK